MTTGASIGRLAHAEAQHLGEDVGDGVGAEHPAAGRDGLRDDAQGGGGVGHLGYLIALCSQAKPMSPPPSERTTEDVILSYFMLCSLS
jgi:hypothetical protein